MIEALNQDHERLKHLLRCEENDPMTAKRQKKLKAELISLIEQEACVVKEIGAILEQLKRDQMIVSEKVDIFLVTTRLTLSLKIVFFYIELL